jgi:hypothetical protein
LRYGAGSEGVVADDAITFTKYVRPGRSTSLIRPCTALKPGVQYRLTGNEFVDLMIITEGFGW